MLYEDENTCCPQGENCEDECDCTNCEYDDLEDGVAIITMIDTETGEEYTFELVDDFVFEDEHYCVLVPADENQEPEIVITRIVTMDDGTEGLMSLDDEEYDRVYEAYARLCEEDENEEADEDGEEED
ncbi:MAG: DUF1292 domain-containing protein [Clostridia bacterium]|nr:DUF1292 domain-containing protein [Clostridia bacterium]